MSTRFQLPVGGELLVYREESSSAKENTQDSYFLAGLNSIDDDKVRIEGIIGVTTGQSLTNVNYSSNVNINDGTDSLIAALGKLDAAVPLPGIIVHTSADANHVGTITVTNATNTVAGTSTAFTASDTGKFIKTAGGQIRKFTYVSATSGTVDSNWGSTETGATFTLTELILSSKAMALPLYLPTSTPAHTQEAVSRGYIDPMLTIIKSITSKSGTFNIDSTYHQTGITFTGTYSVTFDAVASLGTQFAVWVQNLGTGVITFDPNGAEQIQSQTTLAMYPGEGYWIIKNGSALTCLGRQLGKIFIQRQVAANVASVACTVGLTDACINRFENDICDLVPVTDDVDFWMRVSEDGGSTWKSGGTDYAYDTVIDSSNVTSTGAAQILLTFSSAGLKLGNTSADNSAYRVDIWNPAGTALHKLFQIYGPQAQGTATQDTKVSAQYKGTANAVSGIEFLCSSGNISSGVFTTWGWRFQ